MERYNSKWSGMRRLVDPSASSQCQSTFRQKTLLILFGIFLSLIIVELGLRLGESVYLNMQEHRNLLSIKQRGAYRILCLGESMVALGGKDSFPSQLESVLNQNDFGVKFAVINKGIPGGTSDLILEKLPDNIRQYSPNMVIVMMGVNDRGDVVLRQSKYFEIKRCLNHLKILNIFKYLVLYTVDTNREKKTYQSIFESENRKTLISDLFDSKKNKNIDGVVNRQNSSDREKYRDYTSLGWQIKHKGDFKKAAEMFYEAIKIDPNQNEGYRGLAWCYIGEQQWDEAEKMFRKAINAKPDFASGYVDLAEFDLEIGLRYKNKSKLEISKLLFEKAINMDKENDKAYGGLGLYHYISKNRRLADEYFIKANRLRKRFYLSNTVSKYLKMKKILDEKDIKMVVAQYPVRNVEPLKKIFEDSRRIVFVDNEKVFKDAIERLGYEELFYDIFGGDFGHCTAKGNRLLAENIAKTVMQEIF